MNADLFHQRIELFYGGASANRVMVYARLRDEPAGAGLALGGYLRGPHCLYSTTLPATIRLTDAGPGDSLLAKALVPDPCYWSEELPFLYDVHVELLRDGAVIASADRALGMRSFGPRGKFFYLGGKRWTVRGALAPSEKPLDLLAWHDTPLTLVANSPGDALCEEAARVGVMIVARLDQSVDHAAEIARLARHASVGVVALAVDAVDPAWHALAPNLLLARDLALAPLAGTEGSVPSPDFAAVLASADDPQRLAELAAAANVPVIACRAAGSDDPVAARAECDRLQASLAALGDFAGYIV